MGYAEGFERGRRDGMAEAERQQRAAAGRLAGSLATLHALERRILHEVQAEVTELAVAIASKVVRERIAAGEPVAARIAAEVFARIGRGPGAGSASTRRISRRSRRPRRRWPSRAASS